ATDVGAPTAVGRLVQGAREIGEQLVDDPRVALVSATGSVRMGQQVGPRVAGRFGKALLELGGNNAAIVTPSADLDLAVRGIVFSAAGTAGQRCTTLRRVIAHRSVVDTLVERVVTAYRSLPVGDPSSDGTLVGPLIHERSYRDMVGALERELLRQYETRGDFIIDADLEDVGRPTSQALLYRAARELLANINKHAGATEVTIRLFRAGDRIVLTVADDGAGFEPSIVEQRVAEGHIGLASLQARFDSMAGAMAIESKVDHGTLVTVTSPPEQAWSA
ncbi:MAG: aldehyde dehydrogenase, partial [Mycobacterium sp.]|nr:aldehyde dehydrogenase [Mycobacterium sp.]